MSFEGAPSLKALDNEPGPRYSLEEIRKTAEGDELLEELFDDVRAGSYRYFDSVILHERIRQIQVNRMEPEEYRFLQERHDRDRRLAHNALCDQLRILARAEKKAGRDIKWWKDIVGPYDDRNSIRRWALRSVFAELYKNQDKHNE